MEAFFARSSAHTPFPEFFVVRSQVEYCVNGHEPPRTATVRCPVCGTLCAECDTDGHAKGKARSHMRETLSLPISCEQDDCQRPATVECAICGNLCDECDVDFHSTFATKKHPRTQLASVLPVLNAAAAAIPMAAVATTSPLAASASASAAASSTFSAGSSADKAAAASAAAPVAVSVLPTIMLHEITDRIQIGQGAFGSVFKGVFKGRSVAVKQASNASGESAIMEEIDIWKAIPSHPHVLELLGMVQDGSNISIVSQFCEGGYASRCV